MCGRFVSEASYSLIGPIKSIHAKAKLVADKVFDKPSRDTRETRHDDIFIGRPSILLDILSY